MDRRREESMTSIGERLYSASWRQGSLFRGEGLAVTRNVLRSNSPDVTTEHRRLTGDEWCVVVSQDCDVLSDVEQEVEVLVCERLPAQKARDLASNRRYSSRYFLVNPDTGLVALAAERLFVAKEVLLGRDPEDWPTSTRLSRFVQWLGRRYTRPALPNDLVVDFQAPIVDVLAWLAKKQPHIMQAFSEAVQELRVVPPESINLPFDIELVFILNETGLSEQAADALNAVETVIRGAINPERVRIIDIRSRSPEQMSVAEYFSSAPLFLDSLTFRGEEIHGAKPPEAR
jgi:hypothetical protein